jgi:hypothetical protein
MAQGEGGAQSLVRLKVRSDVLQEVQGLPIGDAEGETWRVLAAVCAFGRDLARADGLDEIFEEITLGAGNGHDQAAVFTYMHRSQGDGALAIDDAGDIGGFRGTQRPYLGVTCHPARIKQMAAGHNPGGHRPMVEAAGQLVRSFRNGLDYAFIPVARDAGRVIHSRGS